MLDNRYLQQHLELIFAFLENSKSLGQISRKTNLFVVQREYCALDTWTCLEDTDNRFSEKNEKSFCACKVYPNTLYWDNTRSQ